MTHLPPDARELLARVRAEQPRSTPETRARVRAAVAQAVALSRAPELEELDPLAQVGRSKTAPYLTVLKLAAVTLVVGISGGLLVRSTQPAAVSSPAPHAQAPEPPPRSTELPLTPTAAVTPARETDKAQRASATVERDMSSMREPKESLAAELRLVRQADQALRAGDATAALKALTTHRARFGDGQLANERDGLAVLAECTLGSPGARERATSYLRQGPSSLVEQRLVSACALRPPP